VAESERAEEDRQQQQPTIVVNTPPQPQWSAIQPMPVPEIAEPNT
jgi:hypothetical protein